MSFKVNVYSAFKQLLDEKISHVRLILQELHLSAANETKSTAGDKHETALAMLQIEQENKRKQLSELLHQKTLLDKIDPTIVSISVLNGSLVQTDKGYFFISTALGRIILEGKTLFALSPASPLGQKLMHLKPNDMVRLNERNYTVINIE